METDTAPPSPRCDNGWTLIERPAADGEQEYPEIRPRSGSPSVESSGDQPVDHDEAQDGVKSPESERLADDLLREPFQASGRLVQLPPLSVPSSPAASTAAHIEEPSTPTGASGPYAPSCGDLTCHALHDPVLAAAAVAHVAHGGSDASDGCSAAAGGGASSSGGSGADGSGGSCGACSGCGWGFEPARERERLREVTRLSGEGALEGFQDPHVRRAGWRGQDVPPASPSVQVGGEGDLSACDNDVLASAAGGAATGPHAPCGEVTLDWDSLVSSLWSDLLRELEDVRELVTATAAALWERVRDGRMAAEEWAAAVTAAAHQAAKSHGLFGLPLWALLGMGGLAAVALAALGALGTQVAANRRLAEQLRHRDMDFARLLVKIFNLQDALQKAALLAPTHHHLERYTATTTLIGMV